MIIRKYVNIYNRNKHEDHYILNGSNEQKTLLITDDTNVSLSKNDYCDKAIEGAGNFSTIDWSWFTDLLDYIDNNLSLFD